MTLVRGYASLTRFRVVPISASPRQVGVTPQKKTPQPSGRHNPWGRRRVWVRHNRCDRPSVWARRSPCADRSLVVATAHEIVAAGGVAAAHGIAAQKVAAAHKVAAHAFCRCVGSPRGRPRLVVGRVGIEFGVPSGSSWGRSGVDLGVSLLGQGAFLPHSSFLSHSEASQDMLLQNSWDSEVRLFDALLANFRGSKATSGIEPGLPICARALCGWLRVRDRGFCLGSGRGWSIDRGHEASWRLSNLLTTPLRRVVDPCLWV